MTERLALGITVGALHSVAVAASGAGGAVDADQVAGGVVLVHPSVVRVSEYEAPVFGSAALAQDTDVPHAVIDGFLDRVGDPVDMLAEDGSSHAAADLFAIAVAGLVDEAADAVSRTPEAVVACHPARWSAHTVRVVRDALSTAGLSEVTLVPEQAAAVRWLESTHGPLGPGAVLVYDLGASGLTLSVVRTGGRAPGPSPSLHNTDVAGAEFDLLTMRYVLANTLNGNEFDPFDPASERQLAALRDSCRKAKESLSINTSTVLPVRLGAEDRQIRLVRDELEELLRPPLLTSLDLVRDVVHRAGLDIGDINRVLLTGGGAAIPLVTELLSTEFGLPVVAAAAPAETGARGAAVMAAELAEATAETAPHPALRAAPPAPEIRSLDLPAQPEPRRSTRGRAAVIASAAVLIALLAGGTVAIGTSSNFGTEPSSSNQNATTTGQAPAGADSGSVQPAADPLAPGATHPPGAPPGSPAAPAQGGSAAAVANPRAEQTQNPQSQQPGQQPQSQPTQGQPAQGQSPQPQQAQSPQPQPNTPQPQPAPQPQPTQQIPTQQIPTQYPQPNLPKPQAPSLPTGALSDTIDGVGGAVGTVLQVPGEILGGNGG
ncbi:Hsp70 family protein [Nocardia bovistercoris]|uniref:Hsp70 family protein n=1 Tax=Nocardia bovistercoris TaxID=2785916 RepID=A0A931N4M6_9NOCA|nr:Hsp70 family protein [Nocardia bovistercoris]MBH0778867.1 Hsp70 family protein [Nocardia bovistercoris]